MSTAVHLLSKLFFSADRGKINIPASPASCLIIRQHNQLGDMLATVPLFRAIKQNFPGIKLSVLASPDNYFALNDNRYIDTLFVFDKKKLFDYSYFNEFISFLRTGYDLTVVPATVSVSFTSCLLAGISKSALKLGPLSLDGRPNPADYFFHIPVEMDWLKNREMSVYQFVLECVRPLNLVPPDYHGEVTFGVNEDREAQEFLKEYSLHSRPLVGFHVGAGKAPNIWRAENFASVIKQIESEYGASVFLTGSTQDSEQIKLVYGKYGSTIPVYKNRTIMSLAAMINMADLFITNDTGIMHVAGATDTPQISLFGPTDPKNWAPPGKNKMILRKSMDINDVSVSDVLAMASKILRGR